MVVQLYHIPTKTINMLPERFERKYYIAPKDIGTAYGLLKQICLPAKEYFSEQINSLYFDTADLDQHGRSSSGDYCKDKVRIRWYGREEDLHGLNTVFIELKSRRGFASTKQRLKLEVSMETLAQDHLNGGIIPRILLMNTLARFDYFPSQLLLPIIKISYWRYRFNEVMTEQRLSLDTHIRSTVIIPGPGNGERELELPGGVIEIKGKTMELPVMLRRAKMLDTDWTRFSKYSACLDSHIEQLGTIGRLSPSGRII